VALYNSAKEPVKPRLFVWVKNEAKIGLDKSRKSIKISVYG
jgi:hypothetical protein